MQENIQLRVFGNYKTPKHAIAVPWIHKDGVDLSVVARNAALWVHNDTDPKMQECTMIFPHLTALMNERADEPFHADDYVVAIVSANDDMQELLQSLENQGKTLMIYTPMTKQEPISEDVVSDSIRMFCYVLIMILLYLLFSKTQI